MKKRFSNKVPFILLTIIHLCMFLYNFKKHTATTIFTSLFSNIGMAYIFEYVVFTWLKAYHYFPKIFKNREFDNAFGALLSQAIFVPITATFLTLNTRSWFWKMFFTLYFSIIERIFLHWKLHQNRWWNTTLTTSLILLYFCISDLWLRNISKKIVKVVSYVLISPLFIMHYLYGLVFFKRIKFGYNKYSWREAFKIVPLYGLVQSFIYMFFSYKRTPLTFIGSMFSIFIIDFCLIKLKIIKVKRYIYLFILHIYTLALNSYSYHAIQNTREWKEAPKEEENL
ncbi:hypothetical protein ACWE42_06015 [Sutcliffiella cohnii]